MKSSFFAPLVVAGLLYHAHGIYRDDVDGVTYIEIEDFHKLHPARDITFMLIEWSEPDAILIARTTYLAKYRDGDEKTISGQWLAGYREAIGTNAKYNLITGFIQNTASSLLLVDRGSKLIRQLDLKTGRTSRYAGRTGTTGHLDNTRLNALLTSPFGIIKSILEPNTFYVSDTGTHKIRRLNETHLTTAFDGFPLTSPKGMTLDQDNPLILYVVINHGVAMLNLLSGHATQLNAAGTIGFKDGDFGVVKFSYPENIIQPTKGSFIVTDKENDRLRIMDKGNSSFSSICTGVRGEKNGAISVCNLFLPRCLLSINSSLMLIGEGPELKALKLTTDNSSQWITKPQPPQTTTTSTTTTPTTSTSIAKSIFKSDQSIFSTDEEAKTSQDGFYAAVILGSLLGVIMIALIVASVYHSRLIKSQFSMWKQRWLRSSNQEGANRSSVNDGTVDSTVRSAQARTHDEPQRGRPDNRANNQQVHSPVAVEEADNNLSSTSHKDGTAESTVRKAQALTHGEPRRGNDRAKTRQVKSSRAVKGVEGTDNSLASTSRNDEAAESTDHNVQARRQKPDNKVVNSQANSSLAVVEVEGTNNSLSSTSHNGAREASMEADKDQPPRSSRRERRVRRDVLIEYTSTELPLIDLSQPTQHSMFYQSNFSNATNTNPFHNNFQPAQQSNSDQLSNNKDTNPFL